MSIDTNSSAAAYFYKIVRNFALKTKAWEQAIWHQVAPDEINNYPLISYRVYGNFNEFLTIMASAGANSMGQTLPQAKIILPTPQQLILFKRQAGFESSPDYREEFKPTWAE